MLVVTHYQRLLDYIVPDFVHVLYNGRIVKSGGKSWRWNWKKKDMNLLAREIRVQRSRLMKGV